MKKFLILVCFFLLVLSGTSYASTRSAQIDVILNGLVDASGDQLAGGSVYFYAAGTDTAKDIYTDKAMTSNYASYTLDAYGRALLYGSGVYKFKVYDSTDVLLYTWDYIWIRADNFYQRPVTGTATADDDDDFLIGSSNGGAVTITLFTAADAVKPLSIKRSGSNNVTIDGYGSETIDGSATYVISVDKRSVELISDGTNWQISAIPVSSTWDADADTGIQVDETADEDIIRFDLGNATLTSAAEIMTLQAINTTTAKLEPTTDNTLDLGSSTKEFKDIYSDGTAYLDALNYNGTAITPTAAEINQLNTLGATSISAAQWATLGALTASTTEVNQLDTLGATTISASQWAAIGGMADTVSNAELNYLDITTLGTSQDSKAVTQGAAGIVDIASHNATDEGLSLGGTLVTATAAELNKNDGLTTGIIENLTLAGWTMRPKFRWKDADEIYIGPGAYNHVGTVNQIVYWNQELTIDIGSPTGPDIYYLYIDDSAVVTADTNILTATEFIFSTSPPTYSPAQKGWYSSYDRCIFAVYVEVTSNNIIEFYHSGTKVNYLDNTVNNIDDGDIDLTWHEVDYSVGIPLFAEQAIIEFRLEVKTTDGHCILMARPSDSGAGSGQTIGGLERIGTDQLLYITQDVHIGSDLKFDIVMSRSDADEIETRFLGWHMGKGM